MNCSPPHALTVKYLGSPIILMCVFDRAGMTPSIPAVDMLLTAFCIGFAMDCDFHSHVCIWIYVVYTIVDK